MTELVRIEAADGVAQLVLNDAERRNPLSNAMIEALLVALESPAVAKAGLLVIRGEGADFCAGGDINDFRSMLQSSAAEQWEAGERFRLLLSRLRAARPIIVAAVRGRALGGGCGLVASSDFAIAAADASFGTPEIKLGAFPMVIVPALIEAIGPRRTLQMATTGEPINADEALACGLVQKVVPAAELDETITRLVQAVSGRSASALRIGKACVWSSAEGSRAAGLELGTAMRAILFSSPDFNEGVARFLERPRGSR